MNDPKNVHTAGPSFKDTVMAIHDETMALLEEWPGPDTPLPPTNDALHVLDREEGYGTPDRTFYALCGTSWKAGEGGNKYFHASEPFWFKHVNCPGCRATLSSTRGQI